MKTVVLLSGGIDSTVALAHVLDRGATDVFTLAVDYGQTHRKELDAARRVAGHYSVEFHRLDIAGALDIPSALTRHGEIPEEHAESPDATFVPGRNLVLVSLAVAWANAWGFDTVVLGANADDRAGYPDCRFDFTMATDTAARSAYGVGLWTPFLRMSKSQVVERGLDLDAPLDLTWSCYRGYASECNRCGACQSKREAGL